LSVFSFNVDSLLFVTQTLRLNETSLFIPLLSVSIKMMRTLFIGLPYGKQSEPSASKFRLSVEWKTLVVVLKTKVDMNSVELSNTHAHE